MTENRAYVQNLAQQYIEAGKPKEWFEQLYSQANNDNTAIPWADMKPNHNLVKWLDDHHIQGQGKTALTIGCGLGDDAEELSQRGFNVTAFDISPSAIEWCKNRFPNSTVEYIVADLLNPPAKWNHTFDFVLESYTLQALPHSLSSQAISLIANFLANDGILLVICRGRDIEDKLDKVPYPLTKDQVMKFVDAGLSLVDFADYLDQEKASVVRRFRATFQK
ncbi:class I SAM-dependent methyltransferase [Trichormus variabilis]|uniref:Methyltransferase type 12 n=1 Tax=Trichormus variabilis SAG 1403-4b TaxID=447716 RepID=A0A3S1CQP7_ANAVA|nr:class I SAM-dependent methyltransferase [Trichormus variabilis]MBD2627987.1 class I SAM-dependent methyltransferase [Trichormus variabilis FACHB-164]RUS96703.1 methyltransferase type 12 [Trichormus variabilis SAG 1403-4b]